MGLQNVKMQIKRRAGFRFSFPFFTEKEGNNPEIYLLAGLPLFSGRRKGRMPDKLPLSTARGAS